MKKFLKIALFLLLPVASIAQDTALTISPSMFNERRLYYIGTASGWLFKQGNDTSWSKKDIDVSGWQKLAPVSMSVKYADKNGRAEGWFRLKIKIDNTLTDKSFGVKSGIWAAEDIYVDGHLITSYGNTGLNGKPYHEAGLFGHLAVTIPFDLKPGSEHVIALHFVDYVSPIPPRRLKSADAGLFPVIIFTRTGYNAVYLQYTTKERVFETIWVSVSTVLTLLFWLLFIQNPSEKNLRLIALDTTVITLGLFFVAIGENTGLSYANWLTLNFLNICTPIGTFLGLLVLIRVFNRRIAVWVKIFFWANIAILLFLFFLPQDIYNLVFAVSLFVTFGIDIYYIISSWKNLHGPQWAIVVGLIASFTFAGAYTYLVVLNGSINLDIIQITITGYSLSFPLSLLVYVSMRFKEIITEVRANAAQVVQLSEEKKQEALNRQQLLQKEVNRQTAEIRTALDNLKATQTQLIQSEKMASLGELTAGIAHEIQNPLNFVNNFSEVSIELLDELKEEAQAGNTDDVIAIATDLTQNLEKINHHGKRADFIVKGMLQHSRTSTGEKQLTNINVLADEFLKLSYHGLRAKDKLFNAELITHFDETLPKVNIAQQDIGRVLLNLFNNAFYTVNHKQKTAGPDYKPEVTVSTSAEKNNLAITVTDNGNGIPDVIKDKIMQPFFTTKPTGEGTGLGLSLSYDIIVKGHGGSIMVDSTESKGSEFTIYMPII